MMFPFNTLFNSYMAIAGIPIQTLLIYCYATTIHTRELGLAVVKLMRQCTDFLTEWSHSF